MKKGDDKNKGIILTGIDALLDLVDKKGRITLKEAAAIIKYPEDAVEDWAGMLEEEGLISVEYKFTKTILVSSKNMPAKQGIKKEKGKEKPDDKLELPKEIRKVTDLKFPDKKSKFRQAEAAVADSVQQEMTTEPAVQRDNAQTEAPPKKSFIKKFFEIEPDPRDEQDSVMRQILELKKVEQSIKCAIADLQKKDIVTHAELDQRLKQAVDNEKEDIKNVLKKPVELNEQIISLKKTIEGQQQQIKELGKANSELKSDEEKLMKELKASNLKLASAKQGKIYAKKPLFSILANHISRRALIKKYNDKIMGLEANLSQLGYSQGELRDKIEALEKEKRTLKEHESFLREQMDHIMKEEKDKREQEIQHLRRKMELIQKSGQHRKEKPLLSVIANHISRKGASSKYKKRLEELENELSILKNSNKVFEEQIRKLESGNSKEPETASMKTENLDKRKREKLRKKLEKKMEQLRSKREKLQQKIEKTELAGKNIHKKAKLKTLKGVKQSQLLKLAEFAKSNSVIADKVTRMLQLNSQADQGKSTLMNTNNYEELIEEANKELSSIPMTNREKTVKHEPFAQQIIDMVEQEMKKGRVSKTKLKSLKNKKQRIREKLRRLEIEQGSIEFADYLTIKQSLYRALDKINDLLEQK